MIVFPLCVFDEYLWQICDHPRSSWGPKLFLVTGLSLPRNQATLMAHIIRTHLSIGRKNPWKKLLNFWKVVWLGDVFSDSEAHTHNYIFSSTCASYHHHLLLLHYVLTKFITFKFFLHFFHTLFLPALSCTSLKLNHEHKKICTFNIFFVPIPFTDWKHCQAKYICYKILLDICTIIVIIVKYFFYETIHENFLHVIGYFWRTYSHQILH